MQLSKSVATQVKQGIKLSIQQGAKTEQEFREMDVIPYASAVASLMYSQARHHLCYELDKQIHGESWQDSLGSCENGC